MMKCVILGSEPVGVWSYGWSADGHGVSSLPLLHPLLELVQAGRIRFLNWCKPVESGSSTGSNQYLKPELIQDRRIRFLN